MARLAKSASVRMAASVSALAKSNSVRIAALVTVMLARTDLVMVQLATVKARVGSVRNLCFGLGVTLLGFVMLA
ncbi:hypothetical protein Lal_00024685 [Lupinus albus]|nr:hypothetical protein Lal_00024685 [Lupinus albus]